MNWHRPMESKKNPLSHSQKRKEEEHKKIKRPRWTGILVGPGPCKTGLLRKDELPLATVAGCEQGGDEAC